MPLNQRGVLSFFQRFIPISAFYPHFSVLSPFQRFIPISAFYSHFSVLSSFQRFIPISAFYPHFSVLFSFQRFILISAFHPHFSFRFQFQFPPFSFSVLSQPLKLLRTLLNASVESVRLFSSDRVCLKSAQSLCLIEYMPRKCTAILFNQVCLGSVKPHCFI